MPALSAVENILAQTLMLSSAVEAQALTGRLRHLSINGFPPILRAGRGAALDYGPIETLALALVLELGQAFVPPLTAASIIIQGWPEIERGFSILAAGDLRAPRLEIRARGLASLGRASTSAQGAVAVSFGGDALRALEAVISIAASDLLDRLAEAAALVLGAEGRADVIETLAAAPFEEKPDTTARLSGKSFYWSRAVQLLDGEAWARGGGLRLDERQLLDYLRHPLSRGKTKAELRYDGVPFLEAIETLVALSAFDAEVDTLLVLRTLAKLSSGQDDLRARLLDFATRQLKPSDRSPLEGGPSPRGRSR